MTVSSEQPVPAIEQVEWHWLRLHLERNAVIVVSPDLDLTEAAGRIAADDTAAVSAWIAAAQLTKPTLEQISAWNADPARRFRMTIVQPYVLIQDLPAEPETKE